MEPCDASSARLCRSFWAMIRLSLYLCSLRLLVLPVFSLSLSHRAAAAATTAAVAHTGAVFFQRAERLLPALLEIGSAYRTPGPHGERQRHRECMKLSRTVILRFNDAPPYSIHTAASCDKGFFSLIFVCMRECSRGLSSGACTRVTRMFVGMDCSFGSSFVPTSIFCGSRCLPTCWV